MERIAMSREERDWLDWLKRARDGKMRQWEAAEQMGVSDRWVRKLLQRTKRQGAAAVVHGLRGGPSNRKRAVEIQRQAVAILKQPDWHDFGPAFAAEQLAKRHQIQVGKQTLRGWIVQAGLWKSKSRRARITTPVAKAPGCRVSLIGLPRRCGGRWPKNRFGRRSFANAQSLGSAVSPEACAVLEAPPRRPVETTRV